jgi:hypothetical protein
MVVPGAVDLVTIDLLPEDTLILYVSPHRLNLQLYCARRTPARMALDVWPPFPIVMAAIDEDNIMATLEHNDRVCEVKLWFFFFKLAMRENLSNDAGAMQRSRH